MTFFIVSAAQIVFLSQWFLLNSSQFPIDHLVIGWTQFIANTALIFVNFNNAISTVAFWESLRDIWRPPSTELDGHHVVTCIFNIAKTISKNLLYFGFKIGSTACSYTCHQKTFCTSILKLAAQPAVTHAI